jgi:hypothetical protein
MALFTKVLCLITAILYRSSRGDSFWNVKVLYVLRIADERGFLLGERGDNFV